ncbi:MAG: ribosome-associated translation inhibitor RaiA [Ignavibacteriae bacterium]|jgi:putative sigma-54 modulation protein|nr:ribosome-associated translation inhibitor RaiA [Ignavibacteriota bacterium]
MKMKINITARHFRAKESTKDYIKARLESFEKYNENILHADVILSYDKPPADTKYCEIIIKLRDKLLTATESAVDFEKATDLAAGKIEIQLYKVKDKIKAKKHKNANIK